MEAAILGVLLAASWGVLKANERLGEIEHQLGELNEDRPADVLECPYGYGTCFAFPGGAKPCEPDEQGAVNRHERR